MQGDRTVRESGSAAESRMPRVTLMRLEDEHALRLWEGMVRSSVAGAPQGPAHAAAADDAKMVWRLISSNMRPLGVSARRFVRIDDARADAREVILRGTDLIAVPVAGRGGWLGWTLELDGTPAVVADHGYRRRIDRDKAMNSALRALQHDVESILAPLPFDGDRWLSTRTAAALRRQLVEELEKLPPKTAPPGALRGTGIRPGRSPRLAR